MTPEELAADKEEWDALCARARALDIEIRLGLAGNPVVERNDFRRLLTALEIQEARRKIRQTR